MNRRMRRLQRKHGITGNVSVNNNNIEMLFDKPLKMRVAEIDYDENGEKRGCWFEMIDDNGNVVDASEVMAAARAEVYERSREILRSN